ncbi:hypothetical protein OS493_004435 [Desmophyllum pertusum]|uniref:Uncharacterized protein n=1 Tax=Desmophyllum pertusum TaxID=174260 RepID=A0A9W9ZT32_9CNID|nr:hypothetical protein OS493_004435 [Desmophyllum pertusum]
MNQMTLTYNRVIYDAEKRSSQNNKLASKGSIDRASTQILAVSEAWFKIPFLGVICSDSHCHATGLMTMLHLLIKWPHSQLLL